MTNTFHSNLDRPSFNLKHRLFRAVWHLVWLLLFSWTPPPLKGWRVFLLRCFGAKVANSSIIYGSARIWYPPNLIIGEHAVIGPRVNCYCMDRTEVGASAVISQDVTLCCGTHDISDLTFSLQTAPITIGPRSWIAAEAFIGPGVTINEGAVIGARTVVFKDVEAFAVYVGNPAKRIRTRTFGHQDTR